MVPREPEGVAEVSEELAAVSEELAGVTFKR